jgi:hypothetical protein
MRTIGLVGVLVWVWVFCSAQAQEIQLQAVAKVIRDKVPGSKGTTVHRIRVQMIGAYKLTGYTYPGTRVDVPTLSIETFTILADPSRNPRMFLVGGKQTCRPFFQGRPAYLTATTICPTVEMAETRYQEVVGNYLKPSTIAEDRFPAVTLTEGQEAQVNLSNVRQMLPADQAGNCAAYVTFLAQNGDSLGPPKHASIAPEQTVSVTAPPHVGLMRIIVGLTDIEDAKKACALRSSIEIMETTSRRIVFALAGNSCVGAASCTSQ